MHQIPSTYSLHMNVMNTNLHFPENEHLNCPRCDSDNTKFCYYNNYNLSQPRHYCKNCRRYWTKGGTLRKVPIGGNTRKTNKRSSNSNKRLPDGPDSTTVCSKTAPPPDQLKPEPSAACNSVLKSNYRGRFGGFVDELTGGSEKDGLNGTVVSGGFPVDHDRGDRSGESSGGGGDGWRDLSIFTSGSNFR